MAHNFTSLLDELDSVCPGFEERTPGDAPKVRTFLHENRGIEATYNPDGQERRWVMKMTKGILPATGWGATAHDCLFLLWGALKWNEEKTRETLSIAFPELPFKERPSPLPLSPRATARVINYIPGELVKADRLYPVFEWASQNDTEIVFKRGPKLRLTKKFIGPGVVGWEAASGDWFARDLDPVIALSALRNTMVADAHNPNAVNTRWAQKMVSTVFPEIPASDLDAVCPGFSAGTFNPQRGTWEATHPTRQINAYHDFGDWTMTAFGSSGWGITPLSALKSLWNNLKAVEVELFETRRDCGEPQPSKCHASLDLATAFPESPFNITE